jgi:hypothetical protein
VSCCTSSAIAWISNETGAEETMSDRGLRSVCALVCFSSCLLDDLYIYCNAKPCVLEDNYTKGDDGNLICLLLHTYRISAANYERAVSSLHVCRYVLKH